MPNISSPESTIFFHATVIALVVGGTGIETFPPGNFFLAFRVCFVTIHALTFAVLIPFFACKFFQYLSFIMSFNSMFLCHCTPNNFFIFGFYFFQIIKYSLLVPQYPIKC